jgi:hypothetical protein
MTHQVDIRILKINNKIARALEASDLEQLKVNNKIQPYLLKSGYTARLILPAF